MDTKTKKLIVIYIAAFLILVPLCYFIGITIFNMNYPSSDENVNVNTYEKESANIEDTELFNKLLGIIGLRMDQDENYVEIEDLYVYTNSYFNNMNNKYIYDYVIMLYAINNNLATIDNSKCNLSGKYSGNCYVISIDNYNLIKTYYKMSNEDDILFKDDTNYYIYIEPTYDDLGYEHNISSYYEDNKVVIKDSYELSTIKNTVYYTFNIDGNNISLDSFKIDE